MAARLSHYLWAVKKNQGIIGNIFILLVSGPPVNHTLINACLKQVFAAHGIAHKEIWVGLLSARNRMSHTYNTMDALMVYDGLQEYRQEMEILLAVLKTQD